MLVVMFGSTAILPPRTKRWAEAKVLADSINLKICKLYLYNNEHALALSHYNTHIRIFCDFSRGWGIGEETFEYWSWIARQYRVLAELLEQVTTPGFSNEKKVDHLTIILELYTKAYELFKKHAVVNPQNPTQSRLTLWIAYRIAQTYYDSAKYDMAIRSVVSIHGQSVTVHLTP
ncbi:hypothetical protein C0989_009880 [Termitomyces sp. Mn162]|nr:hypothetical protein C0989_009880 [Termitomyces sp. Mn162]